ncbi:MAG: 5-(carboxyamino)imidazole ribonucleotide mutase [Pseudomonadota bacterium]|nr:5-(carboxyamino)imidazole ribonucleotide mutase [Pseudomonadota bacterium]
MAARKSAKSLGQQKLTQKASQVGVIMGSKSDWPTMKHTADILKSMGIPYETKVVSAHRTPERLVEYAKTAKNRGLKVIIAGAGGAAHLPGMIASLTSLPVLGVPIESKSLSGIDSLLSIVQMPGGIPVGTLAIGSSGAKNAGLMASSIIGLSDKLIETRLDKWRETQTQSVPNTPTGR